jgi:hypothetical protein
VDLDIGIGAEESGNGVGDLGHAEADRDGDAQGAAGGGLHGGDHVVGFAGVLEHQLRPVVIGEADLGGADPPGRAVEETDGEPSLERRDVFRDRRLRDAHLAGRIGEAPVVHDMDEGFHFGEAVHRRS